MASNGIRLTDDRLIREMLLYYIWQYINQIKNNVMKKIQTTVKTGDKIEGLFNGEGILTGEIRTYKQGEIKVFWYINKYSGFSEYLSTRELNRRIKENKIKVIS